MLAQTVETWNGSAGTSGTADWSNAGNWGNSVVPSGTLITEFNGTFANQPVLTGTAGANSLWATIGLTQSVTISAAAPQTLTLTGTGTTNTTANAAILLDDTTNNSSLTLGSNVNVTLLNTSNFTVNNAGTLTLSGSLNITAAKTLTLAGTNASGVISLNTIGATAGLLTVNTAGTVDLTGSMSYTGATTITAGTVNLTGSVAGATAITVNGGNLNETTGGIGSTASLAVSSGTATLGGANTYTGTTGVTGSGLLSLTGTINGSNVTVNGATATLNESSTGVIAGAAKTFTLTAGSAIFSGANTYTGLTTVTSGTLKLGPGGNIASGNNLTTAAAGTFDINRNNQTLTLLTNGGLVTNSGSATTLTIGAGSTGAGAFSGSMNIVWVEGNTGSTLSGSFNNTGTITDSGTGTGTATITGTLGSGISSIIQTSTSSPFTVSTSPITIGNGGFTVTSTNAAALLTVSSGIAGSSGGTLTFKDNGSGNITDSGSNNNNGNIVNSGTGTGTVNISGSLGGNVGTVTQNSSTSQLTLGGANTFTGGLFVNSGTVLLNVSNVGTTTGAAGPSTSAITLGATGGSAPATLLAGSGFTVSNNINLGTTSGTLTIGNPTTGGNVTYSGSIAMDGGNLTVAPTVSGGVTVSGSIGGTGNIIVNNTGLAGTTFNSFVNNSGTITNSGTGTANTVLSGSIGTNVAAVVQNAPNGQLEITGSNNSTWNGAIYIQSGTLYIGETAGGDLDPTGTGIVYMGSGGAAPTTIQFAGQNGFPSTLNNSLISLVPNTAGPIIIAEYYTGAGGGLTINSPVALNGDNLTLFATGQAMTMTGGVSGTGNLNIQNYLLGNDITESGPVQITGTINSVGATNLFSGTIAASGTNNLYINSIIGTTTVSYGLSGSTGGLIVAGGTFPTSSSGQLYGNAAGTLLLNGSNGTATFSGQTQVLSGFLELSGSAGEVLDNVLGTGTAPILLGNTSGVRQAGLFLANSTTLNRSIVVQAGNAGNTTMGANLSGTFTGPITLNKTAYIGGETFNGAIGTGTATIGAVSLVKTGAGTTTINGANTYNGGTVVTYGVFNVAGSTGGLGNGGAVVEGGVLRLNTSINNINLGALVYVGPYGMVSSNNTGILSNLPGTGLLDLNSSGAIGLDVAYSTAITLSNVGDGNMYLGADGSFAYGAGTLGANTDGNYRLGWANGTLTISNSVINSGELIVGGTAGNLNPLFSTLDPAGDVIKTNGVVILSSSNGYGGGTVVNSFSTLEGTAQVVGSPFGSSSASMTLHNATLQLLNDGTFHTTTTVGAFSFDGNSSLQANGVASGSNTLALGAITRSNNGVLNITSTGVLGSTAFITSTGSTALISSETTVAVSASGSAQMLAPYFMSGTGYLTYGASGFVPLTSTITTITGAQTNAYVIASGTQNLTGSGTIAALSISSLGTAALLSNTTSGATETLAITTGGLNTSAVTAATIGSSTLNQGINLDFSASGADAVINVGSQNLIIENLVNAPNGLTKTGAGILSLQAINTSGSAAVVGSNTISGTVTVDNGWLAISGTSLGTYSGTLPSGQSSSTLVVMSDSALGNVTTVLLNGGGITGGGAGDSAPTEATFILSASRTIVLGVDGGSIGNYNQVVLPGNAVVAYPENLVVNSLISGTGAYLDLAADPLTSFESQLPASIILTNTGNNFAAPITVFGKSNLVISAAGELGNSANILTLDGGQAILQFATIGGVNSTIPTTSGTIANPIAFADLGGGVDVVALTSGTSVVLTLSGPISGDGSFYKNGLGTLALTGTTGNTFNGSVIVNAGILSINNGTQLGLSTAAVPFLSGSGQGAADVSGNAAYVEAGAELDLNAGTLAIGGTGGKTLYVSGTGAGGGGAINNVSGTNSDAGQVILQANTAIATGAGSQLTLSGSVSDGGNGYSLTTVGNGMVVLSGSESYTGTTTVKSGTLELDGSLNAGSAVTVDVATLSGTGNIGGSVALTGTSNMSSAGTLTVASLGVSGGGNAVSSGTVNTTGGTTINPGGNLAVNGSLGGSVGVGGVLSGTGTLTGAVTVSAAGVTSPGVGSSTGVLTSDLAYSGSSTANFNVASGSSAAPQAHLSGLYYSQMVVTGTAGQVSLGIGTGVTLGAGTNSTTSQAATAAQILGTGASNSGVTLTLSLSSADYVTLVANATTSYNAKSANSGLDNYFVFNLGSALSTGRFTTLALDVNGVNTTGTIYYSGANDRFAADGVGNTIGDVIVGSQEYALSYTGNFGTNSTIGSNDIVLTTIPEPGTWGMILGGFGMLIAFQRLRRRVGRDGRDEG